MMNSTEQRILEMLFPVVLISLIITVVMFIPAMSYGLGDAVGVKNTFESSRNTVIVIWWISFVICVISMSNMTVVAYIRDRKYTR